MSQTRKRSRDAGRIDEITTGFSAELIALVERLISDRARQLALDAADDWGATDGVKLGVAVPSAGPRRRPRVTAAPDGFRVAVATARPKPRATQPAPIVDPAQAERDAETRRLRALLRPQSELTPMAIPSASAPVPESRKDALRALEDEIRESGDSLAKLDRFRCTARIAAWAGRGRLLQERVAPEATATRRPAFNLFFRRLDQVRMAMDAGIVDALSPGWSVADWDTYVVMNQAASDGVTPSLPMEKRRAHHRSILRSLRLPYRRSAWEDGRAAIEAASSVLDEDDPDMRAARRWIARWPRPPAGDTSHWESELEPAT